MPSKHSLSYYTNASDTQIESRYVRFKRLMRENPLIPIGILFTGAVLVNGASKIRSSNVNAMRKMMRWRIYGQGASLGLLAYVSFKVHENYKGNLRDDSADE
ncbi:unnamed protein product [Hymenolepis diminuta]|uniref:HIG1 domain-containing protein n=1 Tax=Hymenolepis diminuta TaxID=6216 RepID=A0A564YY89_HYMDI|nr:unnamed protein product [Hymenolepis diminuta]